MVSELTVTEAQWPHPVSREVRAQGPCGWADRWNPVHLWSENLVSTEFAWVTCAVTWAGGEPEKSYRLDPTLSEVSLWKQTNSWSLCYLCINWTWMVFTYRANVRITQVLSTYHPPRPWDFVWCYLWLFSHFDPWFPPVQGGKNVTWLTWLRVVYALLRVR